MEVMLCGAAGNGACQESANLIKRNRRYLSRGRQVMVTPFHKLVSPAQNLGRIAGLSAQPTSPTPDSYMRPLNFSSFVVEAAGAVSSSIVTPAALRCCYEVSR
jgi:hypothetical protein